MARKLCKEKENTTGERERYNQEVTGVFGEHNVLENPVLHRILFLLAQLLCLVTNPCNKLL